METEEITKLVDGIYKNILDKFNPGARQMINAGKAYLKALHGAAAASRMYVDAITKLARQSQQGTWGGSSDIGSALMQIVEVYKEIQAQQMNILKAFYVDLLVPLETNLEKDTKVVQSEQKRFLQQHKQRSETYSKAAATMKKQRKKQRSASKTGIAMDKELKSMQILEEERSKLDAFCEQSLKNAMTQERRRYGFVLERQCSLAKHYLAYHSAGHSLYQSHLDDWQEIAKTREFLPQSIENMFASKLNQVNFWNEDGGSPSKDDDRVSVNSQLRKTKSMDASCLDVANSPTSPPHVPLTRAKSDFNLTASTHSLAQEIPSSPSRRPKSMAVPDTSTWDTPLARAMYAYLSSGENQLSFLEGDVIALMGERNKGWQFGENLRTQCSGWFPLAYTEPFIDDTATSASSPTHRREDGGAPSNAPRPAPLTKFGDTLLRNNQGGVPPSGPAPTAPRKVPPNPPRLPRQPPPPSASLHSSNDSGFSNDPPPAPEIDYSDDDSNRRKKSGRRGDGKGRESTSVRGWLRQSTDDWYTDNEGGYERPPPIRHSQSNGHLAMTSSRHSTSASHLATLGRMRPSNNDSQDKIHDIQMQLKAIELPYEKKVKRTKSLWKFKRNEEVIEGMSMWKHRSLIDISDEAKQQATPKPMKKPLSLPRPPTEPPKPPISTDTSSSEEDPLDSESCIVVDDHRKKPEDIVSILPRTHLIKKKDTTLSRGGGGGGVVGGESDIEMTSRRLEHRKNNAKTIEDSWYSSWDDIKA